MSVAGAVAAGVSVDWARADDLGSLQAFVDAHWRRGHVLARDPDLFRWQHRWPGRPERLAVLVARDDAGMLGLLGAIPVDFSLRGRRVPGAWLALWVVTEAARARRVGLGLLSAALAEPFEVVACLGINPSVHAIYRAVGFEVRPSVSRWLGIGVAAAAERLRLVAGARPLPQPVRVPAHDPGALAVRDWEAGDARAWDDLWARELAPGLLATWRDSAYLGWRYLAHPRYRYAVRVAVGADGSPRGLLVHRRERPAGSADTVRRVVDLLGTGEALEALAADLAATVLESGDAFADFPCTDPGAGAALTSAGFVADPAGEYGLPSLLQPPDAAPLACAVLLREAREVAELTAREVAELTVGHGARTHASPAVPLHVTRSDGDQDRPS